MGHALKAEDTPRVDQAGSATFHVKIEKVRIASRRVGRTIENLTDKISQEVGAEADRAIAKD